MDLELYKIFCEVVKYKNISKTAESMFISQSAITQSIQKLESILGGKVFYRNKNGVELTEEGRNLYEYVKDCIEKMSNAENIFSTYVNLEKGKVRIGGGNSLVSNLILDAVIRYIEIYPKIEISINSGITDVLIQKLANGELDMVVLNLPFTSKKYANVEFIPLKQTSYCFYTSKKYAKENNIKDLKDIINCNLILPKLPSIKRKILDDFCTENGIELKGKYEISSSSIIKKMVLKNIGVGFSNVSNIEDIKDEINIIKEIKSKNSMEGIAVLKKSMCSKATIELVNEIKEQYNV